MAIFVKKSPALVEDMEFGFGLTAQVRGGNKVNAEFIPYINGGDNVKQALDNRPTLTAANGLYAPIVGNPAQVFGVAVTTDPSHAVPRSELDVELSSKADNVAVIRKGAGESYTPSAGTDPVNKDYADGLIADKFLGAITGQFIAKSIADGTTDVTVTVTNGVITAIV